MIVTLQTAYYICRGLRGPSVGPAMPPQAQGFRGGSERRSLEATCQGVHFKCCNPCRLSSGFQLWRELLLLKLPASCSAASRSRCAATVERSLHRARPPQHSGGGHRGERCRAATFSHPLVLLLSLVSVPPFPDLSERPSFTVVARRVWWGGGPCPYFRVSYYKLVLSAAVLPLYR